MAGIIRYGFIESNQSAASREGRISMSFGIARSSVRMSNLTTFGPDVCVARDAKTLAQMTTQNSTVTPVLTKMTTLSIRKYFSVEYSVND